MPQIQFVVLNLLLVQMAMYMAQIFASAFFHPLVFIGGVFGFMLPLMGMYALGLRSVTGMMFFIVFSAISMAYALLYILLVVWFNSVSQRENEWGEQEMLPWAQKALAFLDPTNEDWYLNEDGADRIRQAATISIGWIVLQAVYQVVVVIFYARARKEIKEEDRGVMIPPDFTLKGDGDEVVAKFFADRAYAPTTRTARLPSSHPGGLSSAGLRTARPLSRLSQKATDPRLSSVSGRPPLSGSGPRLTGSGPRGNYVGAGPSSGGAGPKMSVKSVGPVGGGGGGPSRKSKFSLKSSKAPAPALAKMPDDHAAANIADA